MLREGGAGTQPEPGHCSPRNLEEAGDGHSKRAPTQRTPQQSRCPSAAARHPVGGHLSRHLGSLGTTGI